MTRHLPVRVAVVAVPLALAGLVATTGITSTTASYSSEAQVTGALHGFFDIAQGPCDAPVQAPTPEEAHLVVDHGSGDPVRRAVSGADGAPAGTTAQVGITVCNLAAVDGALTLSVYDRSAPEDDSPYDDLVLMIRDGDEVVTGAAPVPVGELGSGVVLPQAVGAASSTNVVVDVWLREDAPPTAFSRSLDLGVRIVGQSIAGDVIELIGEVR